MSALGRTMSQMFGGTAVKAAATSMAGGAAAGVAVGFIDSGREKLATSMPALSFLGGVWGRGLSAVVTALVVSGLLRSRSALAAAGASGAMGMELAKILISEFAPTAGISVGLSGSIAETGVGSFLDRLERADRRMLSGSVAQQRLAGSVAQSLGGTVYGGYAVPPARVGIRASNGGM